MFLWIYLFTIHVLKDITLELLFRIRTKIDVYPIDFTHSCVWTSCPNTYRIFTRLRLSILANRFLERTFDLWSSLCIIASAILYVNKFIDVVYVSIPYNFRHDIIYWDLISYLRFFGTFMSSVSLWDYHGVFYTSNKHLVFMLHIFHRGFYLESICLPCLRHVIIK